VIINLRQHFRNVAELRDDILAEARRSDARRDFLREDLTELKKLLREERLSPIYRACQSQIIEALEDIFRRPEIDEAADNWPFMPRSEKSDFLERCLTAHAEIQSEISGIWTEPGHLEWARLGRSLGSSLSDPDSATGENDYVLLNKQREYSFSKAVTTILHEQTHIFQGQLARSVRYGEIGPEHPLYRDGALFMLKQDSRSYINGAIPSAYRLQVEERDAEKVATSVAPVLP
jgi:hypothetical protein